MKYTVIGHEGIRAIKLRLFVPADPRNMPHFKNKEMKNTPVIVSSFRSGSRFTNETSRFKKILLPKFLKGNKVLNYTCLIVSLIKL